GLGDREVWLARVHPEDRELVQKAVDDIRLRNTENYNYELRMLEADGSYRWHQISGHVVERDAAGKAVRMVGIRHDVTGRRQAEEELRRQKDRLEETVERR